MNPRSSGIRLIEQFEAEIAIVRAERDAARAEAQRFRNGLRGAVLACFQCEGLGVVMPDGSAVTNENRKDAKSCPVCAPFRALLASGTKKEEDA